MDNEKKILWTRSLSCGHERNTNIAYMCKNYTKPEVGEDAYCRQCWRDVTIIGVEVAHKEDVNNVEEVLDSIRVSNKQQIYTR